MGCTGTRDPEISGRLAGTLEGKLKVLFFPRALSLLLSLSAQSSTFAFLSVLILIAGRVSALASKTIQIHWFSFKKINKKNCLFRRLA